MKSSKIFIPNPLGTKCSIPAIRYDQNEMVPDKKYPLWIFLHGRDEKGDGTDAGLNRLLNSTNHKNILLNADQRKNFIVLAPQFVVDFNFIIKNGIAQNSWQPDWRFGYYVNTVVKWAIQNLPIDITRIGVTGLSAGGGGTWDAAISHQEFSDLFAWIAPVCPAPQVSDGWNMITKSLLPVWAFHAENDTANPVSATKGPIELLRKYGTIPEPKMTIYPDGGHPIWHRAYATPELYEWADKQVNNVAVPEPSFKPTHRVTHADGSTELIRLDTAL